MDDARRSHLLGGMAVGASLALRGEAIAATARRIARAHGRATGR